MRKNKGIVKWFSQDKGYGFISPDDGGKDVFLHKSALEKSKISNINDGQSVSYDLENGKNGKISAVNLTLV